MQDVNREKQSPLKTRLRIVIGMIRTDLIGLMGKEGQSMRYGIGIDLGSTCAKTVVIGESGEFLEYWLQPTGWSSVETAEAIRLELSKKGYTGTESGIVATGYGRVSVPFANKSVTEISCHARGAGRIFGLTDFGIIDIGGQDTKVIAVRAGSVEDFVMNDKCSAGTGRFLEVMANTLAVTPDELCRMAAEGSGVRISSLCTVFAESEVTGLIGRGEKRENIAFAVVDSIVQKVKAQAARLALGGRPLVLTGGLCGFEYVRTSLSEAFGQEVITVPEARYAGAAGAALYAFAIRLV